jgi:hypothetical protein
MSSFTTDWSTITDPMSNTTKGQEEKKQHKRRFMLFTNVLMKFLERKDPSVFDEARAVIRDCEQKKKRGEVGFESVTQSLRTPLKQVVGGSYWKQARSYLRKDQSIQQFEPLSATEEPPSFSQTDLTFLEQSLFVEPTSPLSTKSCSSLQEETKLRKARFWMLIRVLMKYLEHKDPDMYLKAKAMIKDCVQRNRNREEGYHSLSGVIQTSVKQVVGVSYWRRAESYLSKIIIKRADEEESNDMINNLDYELVAHSPVDFDVPLPFPSEPDTTTTHQESSHRTVGNDYKTHATTPKRTLSLEKDLPILSKAQSHPAVSTAVSSERKRRRVHGLHRLTDTL